MTFRALLAVGAAGAFIAIAIGQDARASATTDQSLANNLVTQAAAPVAASQAAGIIAGAVGGSIGPAPTVTVSQAVRDQAAGYRPYFNLRELARQEGAAAGAEDMKFNLWVNGGYTSVERTDTGGELDGHVVNGVAGVDYLFRENVIGGISFGYESTDIDTTFNAGTFEGAGYTIAPYVGVNLSDRFIWDATLGYSFVEYDTSTGAAFGGAAATFDAERWFVATNLTGDFRYRDDKLRLSPKVGLLYLSEDQESFTNSAGTFVDDTTISLGRLTAGVELGYTIKKIEPFLKVAVEYDWEHEDAVNLGGGNFSSDDEIGAVAGGGLNIFISDRLTGRVEGSMNSLGRDDLDVWTVTGKLNYRF